MLLKTYLKLSAESLNTFTIEQALENPSKVLRKSVILRLLKKISPEVVSGFNNIEDLTSQYYWDMLDQ